MTPRRREPLPALPDAELAVLKALWDGGAQTVRELMVRLGTDLAYTTVQTLVSRLVDKGYVRADTRGLAHVFTATRPREAVAHSRIDELANSLLDGAVAPLVLRLVEKGRFTPAEIAAFRALLQQREQRDGGKS